MGLTPVLIGQVASFPFDMTQISCSAAFVAVAHRTTVSLMNVTDLSRRTVAMRAGTVVKTDVNGKLCVVLSHQSTVSVLSLIDTRTAVVLRQMTFGETQLDVKLETSTNRIFVVSSSLLSTFEVNQLGFNLLGTATNANGPTLASEASIFIGNVQ